MAKSRPSGAGKSSSKRSASGKRSRATKTIKQKKSPSRAASTAKVQAKTPKGVHAEIDRCDREVLKLIDQRVRLVRRLSKLDQAGIVGRVVTASQRIEELVAKKSAGNAIAASSKADVLRHISSVCLQSLHERRAAYLGPKHSYSHLAAIKFFGAGADFAPVASIPAVFDAVSSNSAATGIVPIENSTDGRVVDTLGMFVRRRMQICGEVLLPIHHNLLSRTPRGEISEVYSKPQALSQCRSWLANQLPHARLVEVSSTAAAARLAAEKPGAAAVASPEAGREYQLDVVDANIEDNPHNVTRFAVLGREQPDRTGDDKTAILFEVKHEPGALADVMAIFKRQSLNLTWIESFPEPEKQNQYLFFVEMTGHRLDRPVVAAIETLDKHTQRFEILGSYPRASLV